jgi:ketosteroid isomerase-like protein
MSQENVELAKQAIGAFERRDIEALRALNDSKVELDWSASVGPEGGVHKGMDDVLRFWANYFEAFNEIAIRVDRFIDAGDSIVIPNTSRSVGRNGIEVFARSTFVLTMLGRKVVRIALYQETEQALKAVARRE